MRGLKNLYLSLIIVALTVSFGLFGYSLKQETNRNVNNVFSYVNGAEKSPQVVFLKAWDNINSDYLDPDYNHQDWTRWKNRYLPYIKTKADAYLAIDSMVKSLNDPYTRFLPPSDFQEQDRNIEAKLFGIGVHIAEIGDKIVVIDVIDETPAKKSGLKTGDFILKVNQTSTKGFDLKKVADMIRGKAGTNVILTIQRNHQQLVKKILREKIAIKSVYYKPIDNNLAYIRISSFISEDTTTEMGAALKKAQNAKGIILDLRGNNGGLLPNAIFIANMFLEKGIIVSIVDRNNHKESIKADNTGIHTNKPLVLLINQSSASASEILAGALKDLKRAVLVGEKSYGKGVVQKIFSLPDGSGINITIAKYLTPNGSNIDKIGINPDYRVTLTEKDFFQNKDKQLEKAEQILISEINEKNLQASAK